MTKVIKNKIWGSVIACPMRSTLVLPCDCKDCNHYIGRESEFIKCNFEKEPSWADSLFKMVKG